MEHYEDNESENDLDDNNNNMHEKQDATESQQEKAAMIKPVLETRSSVREENHSNSQDGNQNGCGKCGKRVVKGDKCDLCKNFSTSNMQKQRKRRFSMQVFLYVRCAKRSVANVQITASIKQEQRKR